jgi:hypothetical protein
MKFLLPWRTSSEVTMNGAQQFARTYDGFRSETHHEVVNSNLIVHGTNNIEFKITSGSVSLEIGDVVSRALVQCTARAERKCTSGEVPIFGSLPAVETSVKAERLPSIPGQWKLPWSSLYHQAGSVLEGEDGNERRFLWQLCLSR